MTNPTYVERINVVSYTCPNCGTTSSADARAPRWRCLKCDVYHTVLSLPDTIESTSDRRVENNVLRHEYRVLSDAEKAQIKALKDKGAEFLALIEELSRAQGSIDGSRLGMTDELRAARQRMEEAVMWAVKHVTR